MNKFLIVTRAIIEFAISVHMLALKALAALEDFKVTRAERAALTAGVVLIAQQTKVSLARIAATEAKRTKVATVAARTVAQVAFKAEAARLNREFVSA